MAENNISKEEYQKKFEDDINNMSIEDLRIYTIKMNEITHNYFKLWQSAEEEIEKMGIEIFLLKNK